MKIRIKSFESLLNEPNSEIKIYKTRDQIDVIAPNGSIGFRRDMLSSFRTVDRQTTTRVYTTEMWYVVLEWVEEFIED